LYGNDENAKKEFPFEYTCAYLLNEILGESFVKACINRNLNKAAKLLHEKMYGDLLSHLMTFMNYFYYAYTINPERKLTERVMRCYFLSQNILLTMTERNLKRNMPPDKETARKFIKILDGIKDGFKTNTISFIKRYKYVRGVVADFI
jgi:hypothetical protein